MADKMKLHLLNTGVPGLDAILGDGLPELSFNIIGGAPGSGKTTFAQQIMFALAGPNRKALFFTAMGETPVKMLRYQQQFSFFDFDKVGSSINFISLAPVVEQGNYDAVLQQIREEVRIHQPSLVFIDSFRSFIQGARGEQQQIAALQSFVQQLVVHMTAWEATTFLIGEYLANEADQNPIFTVADGLIWLTQHMHGSALSRKIQVIKMRGRKQRSGLHTFRISDDGVEIFPRMIAAPDTLGRGSNIRGGVSRLSMGLPVLDDMMCGGLPNGYSLLVVGPPGSGKTILATEFLSAGARAGEKSVLALFEKNPNQILNVKLNALVEDGSVEVLNLRDLDLSVDEMLHELILMIDRLGATRVVLDSLPGFELALAAEYRVDFRESVYRMTTVLSEKGVCLLMTTELEDCFDRLRFSEFGNAFLVDAIIMQRYVESKGSLHTVISVVKMRGSAHSRELRQFEVTDDGVRIGTSPAPFRGMLLGVDPNG